MERITEKMIDAKLNHIEDITADDRTTLIKLVKQTNQIVKFLSSIDVEPYEDEYDTMTFPSIKDDKSIDSDKLNSIKELVDEYMTKHKNLKELEKELKKYKDDITPGQIGEA